MPIRLSGIDAGTTEYGIGSYMMAADRVQVSGSAVGTAADITNVDNFHKRRYNFETLELSGNAPGIDVPIIGNSPSDFPSQQGPLDIINGFTVPGYVEGLEPFYRQLVNDERELDPTTATVYSLGSLTSPSLTSDESGGRDAASADNAIGNDVALSTTPVQGSTLTASTIADAVGVESTVAALTITPSVSVTGTVTIAGTDYNDVPISEVFTFDAGNAVNGNKYFKTITTITASADLTPTIDIGTSADAEKRRYIAIFRENAGGRLLHGMDIYARKGSVPNTYREVFMDGLSFSFSRDGSISLAFTAVGKRPQTNTFVTGTGYAQDPEPADTPPGTVAPHSYRLARRQAFVGWQSGLIYGTSNERVALIDATFTLANNILFSPTITGRRPPGGAYRNRRNVTLEGTMEYRSEDNNLMNDVLGNEFLEDVALEQVNVTTGGFPYKTRYEFGRLQFVNLPDAPVSEEGIISRPVSMKAVESEDGTKPDVSIRVETIGVPGSPVPILPLAAITL